MDVYINAHSHDMCGRYVINKYSDNPLGEIDSVLDLHFEAYCSSQNHHLVTVTDAMAGENQGSAATFAILKFSCCSLHLLERR